MKKSKHWLMKKCYVYIYYDVDGTPIYVGIGRNDRWLAHWKLDTHLGRLLRKRERELGICLYPEFIEADNWEDAQLGEVLYVWCFGRADLGLGPLFNLTDGGEGANGAVRSQETLDKMSVAQKGKPKSEECKAKISIANTGKSLSAEHKDKLILSIKGKPKSNDHKLKLSAALKGKLTKPCTIDGITIYPSRKALIDALGQGKQGKRHPGFRYV